MAEPGFQGGNPRFECRDALVQLARVLRLLKAQVRAHAGLPGL